MQNPMTLGVSPRGFRLETKDLRIIATAFIDCRSTAPDGAMEGAMKSLTARWRWGWLHLLVVGLPVAVCLGAVVVLMMLASGAGR